MSSTTSSNVVPFGARRWQWLNQVHDDPEMTGDACKVMYQIAAKCLDSKSEHPFTTRWGDVPIARLTKVHVNTVRNSLTKAERLGHISTIPARGRTPRTITLIVKDLSHNVCESNEPSEPLTHNLTHKMTHKGNSGSPAESKGCAPISYISYISHKQQLDSKSGNPRQEQSSRELPPEFQKWFQGLPRMPREKFWDQRRPEDAATLERYRRAANGSGMITGLASS